MKTKKGFTLIELMVVMGIIALLVGMSLFGISLVQRSSRNTQRRDAARSIELAVRDQFERTSSYPTSITFVTGGASVTVGSTTVPLKGPAKAVTGASGATSTSGASVYCYISNSGAYGIGVMLEGGTNDWFEMGELSCKASPATF